MMRTYQILMPLLSLFLVRVDLTDLFPLQYQASILRIIDGDTLLIRYGGHTDKLRLSRIDAPEKGQPFLSSTQDAGRMALECTEKQIKQKSYTLFIEKRDIYGRLLGDLDQLSLDLVRGGCVVLYPHAVFASKKEKADYQKALILAKQSRVGLWKFGGYLEPKIWRKKFSKRASHRPKHQRAHFQKPYRPEQKS